LKDLQEKNRELSERVEKLEAEKTELRGWADNMGSVVAEKFAEKYGPLILKEWPNIMRKMKQREKARKD
jgi:cell division septum initiation protein DivIVA